MLSTQTTSSADRQPHTPPERDARAAGPRVLVLMAAYNGARWIGQQIDSILAQEDIDVLLAIRDDCSTDDTQRALDRFAGDRRVQLTSGAVPTGSAAGNFLALIRENPADAVDFVAFADQDDVWDRGKLCSACRRIASEGAAGYSGATLAVWEDGRKLAIGLSGAPTGSDFLFEGAGQGCTFVLTSALYERIRHFVNRHADLTAVLHYHDWAVYALARAWGLRWSFDSQPLMKYRQHAGNDTGARGTLAGIARRFALIRRGWYRKQLLAIAGLCSAAAPANATVAEWRSKLTQSEGWVKRWQIARFCLRGARRRRRDNAILVIAALAGWI